MTDRRFRDQWSEFEWQSLRLRIHSLSSTDELPGTPVVFVPGLGTSGLTMVPTARLLPPGPDLLLVDLPGLGESAKLPRPLDVGGYAETVAAWLRTLELERVVLVGHSFGSQVVVELAARRPGLVERVALVSPTVDPANRSLPNQLLRLMLDATREPLSLLRLLMRDYRHAGFSTMREIGGAALRDRVEDKLPSLHVPTLVVRGGRDPLVPMRWAETICLLLPEPKLVVLPEATHAVPFTAPDALAHELQSFLAEPGRVRTREGVESAE